MPFWLRRQTSAVYALACKMNHSCRPNCHTASSRSFSCKTVHALRPIGAGEEITVSYAEAGCARTERRAALEAKFGFACACPLCELRGADLEASDGRQRRLAALVGTLGGLADADPRLEALVEERGRLLKAEGLPPEWGFHEMFRAFMHCHKCGGVDDSDVARADGWLRRALAAATTILGHDSKVVAEFRSIAEMRGCA